MEDNWCLFCFDKNQTCIFLKAVLDVFELSITITFDMFYMLIWQFWWPSLKEECQIRERERETGGGGGWEKGMAPCSGCDLAENLVFWLPVCLCFLFGFPVTVILISVCSRVTVILQPYPLWKFDVQCNLSEIKIQTSLMSSCNPCAITRTGPVSSIISTISTCRL